MKSIRSIQTLTTALLLGLALTGTAAAKSDAGQKNPNAARSGPVTRTTTEIGPDGRATERIVVTENNGDGTITRITQVIHPDGTTETRGVRLAARQKG